MKKIYENEIKILGTKVDELSNEKSKYKLDSCNLDLRLREMAQKLVDTFSRLIIFNS